MEENLDKIEKGPKESFEKEPSFAKAMEGKEEILEKRERPRQEKESREELEQELQKIKLSSEAQVQAQKQAEEIKKETVQGKIQHLMDLAKAQGLAYAVEVARKMDDPYLLDLFHDDLAKDGLFKKFLEK